MRALARLHWAVEAACSAEVVELSGPYVPGYLAFREVSHYVRLLERLRRERPDCVPDVVVVDGCADNHH